MGRSSLHAPRALRCLAHWIRQTAAEGLKCQTIFYVEGNVWCKGWNAMIAVGGLL